MPQQITPSTRAAALPLHDPERLFEVIRPRLNPSTGSWSALLSDPRAAAAIRGVLTAKLMETRQLLITRAADLDALRQKCRGTAGGKEIWQQAKAEHTAWRAGALRFQTLVERRLMEVKVAHQQHNAAVAAVAAEVHNGLHRDALRRLAQAVREHQRALTDIDEPEPEDEQLWRCLDEISAPYRDGEASLRHLVENVWFDNPEGQGE